MIAFTRNMLMNYSPVFSEIGDRIYPYSFPDIATAITLPAVILSDASQITHITRGKASTLRVSVVAMSNATEYSGDIAARITKNVVDLLNTFTGGNDTDVGQYVESFEHVISVPGIDEKNNQLFTIHSDFNVIWRYL